MHQREYSEADVGYAPEAKIQDDTTSGSVRRSPLQCPQCDILFLTVDDGLRKELALRKRSQVDHLLLQIRSEPGEDV